MSLPQRKDAADPPTALHERAMDDLRFIRQTMERAGTFTAVPGWGNVAMGLTALVAAIVASRQPTPDRWLVVWLITTVAGACIGAGTLALKARHANVPLSSGPGRTVVMSLLPPLGVAAALTGAIYVQGVLSLLPGLWHLSYGAAILSAGAFSIRVVPFMGMAFMVVGALALATPATWGNAWMMVGFGGLHIVFGTLIARRHGG